MFDYQLFPLIGQVLKAGLASIGQGGIVVVQNYQPEQEGASTGPALYVSKVGPDKNVGSPRRSGQQGNGAASFTAFITGNLLNVTNVASGTLQLNQGIIADGVPNNMVIIDMGIADGGVGVYTLNYAPGDVASEVMASIGTYVHTEMQQKESKFQVMGLVTLDPKKTNQLTASDIANLACYVMQSSPTIQTLEAQGVGMLKIPEIRNPYFLDDRQRFEASPSFDFTLTHKQPIITTTPIVTGTDLQIVPV